MKKKNSASGTGASVNRALPLLGGTKARAIEWRRLAIRDQLQHGHSPEYWAMAAKRNVQLEPMLKHFPKEWPSPVTVPQEVVEKWLALTMELDVPNIDIEPISKEPQEPPIVAELLLEFIPARRRQALIGDLRERFARDREELGNTRAVRRYWAQCLRSLLPLLIQAVRRVVVRWGIIGAIIEAFHRWSGGS